MGGFGSSRWQIYTKKDTVEESRSLSIVRWMQERILQPGRKHWGSWMWTHPITKESMASISYELDTTNMQRPWVRLYYTLTQSQQRLDYRVILQTTRPHFGGLRWWFVCPLSVQGQACRHRVAKLYLPPGGHYFGCRHCYDLTYTSCQESDKRVSFLRNHPDVFLALLKGGTHRAPTSQLLLALKAARRL